MSGAGSYSAPKLESRCAAAAGSVGQERKGSFHY